MDDLTSLKQSLDAGSQSLQTLLIDSLDHSESDAESANLLDSFWDTLTAGQAPDDRQDRLVSLLPIPTSLTCSSVHSDLRCRLN